MSEFQTYFNNSKAKAKASDSYTVHLTGTKSDQPHFTILEVAGDWQEPMVLQH